MKMCCWPCGWLIWLVLFLVFQSGGSSLLAQDNRPPGAEQMVAAFALRPPDEGSPFFGSNELAKEEMRTMATEELQGAMLPDGNAQYPTVRGEDRTMLQMLTGFFTGLVGSIRTPWSKEPMAAASLRLEPPEFSLSDRREVEANFQVANRTRRILRLDYPTTQRIEILTRAPSGEVIERWSDDRSFQEEQGIVFINPGERISYTEKIPTREMKAGDTYTVEAEVVGHEDFRARAEVVPRP